MERKIDEVFDCDGVKLKVVREKKMCVDCYFHCTSKCKDLAQIRGECQSASRSDGGVIFVKVEDMEERTIKLSLEKAREFYDKGGEFKDLALSAFSEEELNALPNTWEEYKARVKNIGTLNSTRFQLADSPFTNTELRAFLKLKFLRDYYRGKWKPDYKDNTTKPIIVLYGSNPEVKYTNFCGYFLTFQSVSIADKFFKNFKNLIIEASSYLS